MTDIEDRLSSIEDKLDQVIQRLEKTGISGSAKAPKKKAPASKVEQFKLSTQDLLDSTEPLCAYMQRSEDCEGHCGKPAAFSVIRDRPVSLDDLDDLKESKNERAAMLRKSFLRCNGCKSKAQKAEHSRSYKEVKKYIYRQTGEDTAVAADLDAMMGSPSKKTKTKTKTKKPVKSDDEADVQEGLDDPEDHNENLLKTDKWSDKFVKVSKKNMIVRAYKDKRKKDVCIGLIDTEPEDDQYEESLRKPSKAFLEKVGLKYLTPEDAAKGTPPKASKKISDEGNDSSDEDEKEKPKKGKAKKDDEDEDEKPKKGKAKKDDEDEDEKEKPKKGKAKKAKAKVKDSDDEDDPDGEDGEAEAFRDMADSD